MKKVLLIILVALFVPKTIHSQEITSDILLKYVKFISIDEKSVTYEVTIEYISGSKTFITLGNKITSYDVSIPEFNLHLNSPEIKGLRIEDGTVWIGSKPTRFNNINSIDVHRETWFDENNDVVSDVVYSESPTIAEILINSDVDVETQKFIDAMVVFIKSKN